jgi:FlaA1/EpsC-like NDP-sugar epimerase
MDKTPLVGKKVTIVCDENTLQELYKINDHQWDNFEESEFMFFIGDVEDAELNDEQMEFYQNNEGEK